MTQKIAYVTGGMGGIGTSMCQRLLRDGFTMALAQEVASKGVTVNTVSPGYIATEMVKAIRQDVLDKIVAGIPVKRLGTPDDIASIVSWVASGESGFATGADFSVHGGLHMG